MSHNASIINNFIIPESDKNQMVSKLLEIIRNQSVEAKALDHFWQFYQILKLYQSCPKYKNLSKIKILFEKLFTQETKWSDLNKALKSIYENSKELLMVLSFPEEHKIQPLHQVMVGYMNTS